MSSAPNALSTATTAGDAAWVTLPVPFPPGELAGHCCDIEAIFRVNPYYTFHSWKKIGENRYAVDLENHSNQTRAHLELHVSNEAGTGVTVNYAGGIKRCTILATEPAASGSRLKITDDYELLPEAERAQRVAEVDKSLNAWGEALRVYFLRLRRWSWLPGYRWYLRRVWVPMKPSARRIVWLLYLFTAAEFFFFLFVVLIWWIEHH